MKEKILVLTSSFPVDNHQKRVGGGAVLKLSELICPGFESIIVTPKLTNSIEEINIPGIQIFRFKFLPFKRLYRYFNYGIFAGFRRNMLLTPLIIPLLYSQFNLARKLIKKNKIKIIHVHWMIPQGLIAVMLKLCIRKIDIKIIISVHGSDMHYFNDRISLKLKRFILSYVDELTTVSNDLKEKAKRLGYKKRIHVYPMGVDTVMFSPDKRNVSLKKKHSINGPFLLFIGRLSPEKGVDKLIHAMAEIVKIYSDSKLLIIGDGILKGELKTLCELLKLQDHILFTGNLSHNELPAYYATANIFIGPSIHEGFGLTFAEAASCGCLIISSDLSSIGDIIIQNKTGFSINTEDPQAICDKVLDVLRNKDNYRHIKKQAREHVMRNFDWHIVASKYMDLMQNIITVGR